LALGFCFGSEDEQAEQRGADGDENAGEQGGDRYNQCNHSLQTPFIFLMFFDLMVFYAFYVSLTGKGLTAASACIIIDRCLFGNHQLD